MIMYILVINLQIYINLLKNTKKKQRKRITLLPSLLMAKTQSIRKKNYLDGSKVFKSYRISQEPLVMSGWLTVYTNSREQYYDIIDKKFSFVGIVH